MIEIFKGMWPDTSICRSSNMSIIGLQNVLQILHSSKSLKSYTPVNPLIEAMASIWTSYFHPLACIIRDLASVATSDVD